MNPQTTQEQKMNPQTTQEQTEPKEPKKKLILTEDLKQFNIFSAMLHLNNHHFLEQACMLLVRKRDTKNIPEMIAYDKLFELVLKVKMKTNQETVQKYISKYQLHSICT